MSTFNYIRVSTQSQNTERQLLNVPSDIEFLEKISGKNTEREQLNLMLKIIKSGDVVNVHSMDRLARNTQDLLKLVDFITSKGATITFHKENMTFNSDASNPMNKLMLTMLGAFAEFERNIMLERQREGIAIAKANGKYKGRKSSITEEQLQEMKLDFESDMKKTEIAKKYNLTRARIYQLCSNQ
jgi:DNA invertase Pin-like site-specific DNA recombinase